MKNIQFPSAKLGAFKGFLFQAWSAADTMLKQQEAIEFLGPSEAANERYDEAKEALKSAWLAIEATGIMPALFSHNAGTAVSLYDFSKEENFNAFAL